MKSKNNVSVNFFQKFDKVCRVCLIEKNRMNSLYDNRIALMYTTCTSVIVSPSDKLPGFICRHCVQSLAAAYNFHELCEKSNLFLSNYMQKYAKVEEEAKTDEKNESTKEKAVGEGNAEDILEFIPEDSEVFYDNQIEVNNCIVYRERASRSPSVESLENVSPSKAKDFNCRRCNENFYCVNDLHLHNSTHFIEEKSNFSCIKCNAKFSNGYQLKRHIEVHMEHKQFLCEECGERFALQKSLKMHQRYKHVTYPRSKNVAVCHICGKSFSEMYNLKIHLRVHSGERPFMCSICGKTFYDSRSLSAHRRQHANVKRHSCPICNKKFFHSCVLKSHIRVHTGECPFECKQCGRKFKQYSNLEKHKRIHTGFKPHICFICEKKFAQKQGLTMHLRRHNGVKPFSCSICSKAFTSTSEVKRHEKCHTGNKRFSCSVCKRPYTDKRSLVKHEKTHLPPKIIESKEDITQHLLMNQKNDNENIKVVVETNKKCDFVLPSC